MNEDMNVSVTGRHVTITPPMKEYAQSKLESIGIDYPKVINAHIILDVQKYRHICEIVLTCTNHIRIEADVESEDMYASIDLCIAKIMRQMRKHKTKGQKHTNKSKRQPVA